MIVLTKPFDLFILREKLDQNTIERCSKSEGDFVLSQSGEKSLK